MEPTSNNTARDPKGGPLSLLLRPPVVFLEATLLGIAANHVWPFPFLPSVFTFLGLAVALCAVLLFGLSVREFHAAGTPVPGTARTTRIVRSGLYRFMRNPIYLSFILFMLGLSVWLNDLWLLVTLVPAIGFIAVVVIPREERFLERNFGDDYLSYRAAVRRWL